MIINRGSSDSRSVSKEKRSLPLPVSQKENGAKSLDELLEYINGGPMQQQSDQQPLQPAAVINGGTKSSSKAAKRQRQKQRKEEERARIKQQQQQRIERNVVNVEVQNSNDMNETDLEVEKFKRYVNFIEIFQLFRGKDV